MSLQNSKNLNHLDMLIYQYFYAEPAEEMAVSKVNGVATPRILSSLGSGVAARELRPRENGKVKPRKVSHKPPLKKKIYCISTIREQLGQAPLQLPKSYPTFCNGKKNGVAESSFRCQAFWKRGGEECGITINIKDISNPWGSGKLVVCAGCERLLGNSAIKLLSGERRAINLQSLEEASRRIVLQVLNLAEKSTEITPVNLKTFRYLIVRPRVISGVGPKVSQGVDQSTQTGPLGSVPKR